jgi:hypothetical protein
MARPASRRQERRIVLGGRSTVGHVALDHGIGVRIPASQPDFARASRELRLGRRASAPTYRSELPDTGEVCPAEAAPKRASLPEALRRRTHSCALTNEAAQISPNSAELRRTEASPSFRRNAAALECRTCYRAHGRSAQLLRTLIRPRATSRNNPRFLLWRGPCRRPPHAGNWRAIRLRARERQ